MHWNDWKTKDDPNDKYLLVEHTCADNNRQAIWTGWIEFMQWWRSQRQSAATSYWNATEEVKHDDDRNCQEDECYLNDNSPRFLI